MFTTRDTVHLLCKSIMNRLENNKAIEFNPRLRKEVQDSLYKIVGPGIITEADLREQTFQKLGLKADALHDSGIAETDQYRTAKAMIKKSYGTDELRGMIYVKSIKNIAQELVKHLMSSQLIEEVYEEDSLLEKHIVEIMQHFDPAQVH